MGGEKERKELVITCRRGQKAVPCQMEQGCGGHRGRKLISYISSVRCNYSQHRVGQKDWTENMQICLLSPNQKRELNFENHVTVSITRMATTSSVTELNYLSMTSHE